MNLYTKHFRIDSIPHLPQSHRSFVSAKKLHIMISEQGFAPIGEVLPAGEGYGGMSVVDEIYSNYYEKPDQWKIEQEGDVYLNKMFPLLSFFVNAEFVEEQDENK